MGGGFVVRALRMIDALCLLMAATSWSGMGGSLVMAAKVKGRFIDPMLLLRTDSLPNDGDRWAYQLKFDGYRAIAFKTCGKTHLRSRNDNDFSVRYSNVVKGLAKLPDETVIDGEVIALDEDGRPSFKILQNYGSSKAPVLYFVFDVMVLAGRDVMREPLEMRRELLEKKILPRLSEPVRYAAPLDASFPVLIESHRDSKAWSPSASTAGTRAGLRSGAWEKMRVNRGQEFVVGGYTVGTKTFDALIFGYYEGDRLDIRCAHSKRIHADRAGATVQEIPRAGNQGLPVRESAGSEERPMGRGSDGSEDEGLPLAQAGAGRSNRVPGVDGRKSPAPHQVHCAARRQSGTRGYARVESLEAGAAEADWRPVLASGMTLQPPAAASAAVPDTRRRTPSDLNRLEPQKRTNR